MSQFNRSLVSAFTGLLVALSSSAAFAQHGGHGGDKQHGAAAAASVFAGDPYLLDSGPVTGDKLPDKPVIYSHGGRELRFANEKNVAAFKADPAKYLAKVDQAMIQQQLPFYPLDVCPVTGEKLGSMGQPADVIYKNRLVRFCCKGCIKELDKDSGRIVAKLNQAVIAKQGPSYPLSTCPVSKDKLGGDMGKPVDVVIGNRLVRLCCKGCDKELVETPLKVLAQIDQAAKKAPAGAKPAEHGAGHGH